MELIIEAKDNDTNLFKNEAADLLYHYLILLKAKGVCFARGRVSIKRKINGFRKGCYNFILELWGYHKINFFSHSKIELRICLFSFLILFENINLYICI